MKHSEFIQRIEEPGFLWGVRGFYRPAIRLWGVRGALPIMLGAFGILLPTVGIAVYCLHTGKYLSLIWVLPSLFAFLTSSPGLNAIALGSYFLIIMAGIIIGVISGGFHHLVAGFIPGITWFAVGALKGTTMVAMEEELKESEDSYHRFRADDTLFFLK
jgi:hypothetical protein